MRLRMKLRTELTEGLRIAFESIRGNLLRSVLTTVGIVIGIVTVTLMATVIQGLDKSFSQAISFLGTDVLHVDQREWFIDSDVKWDAAQRRSRITLQQVRAVERGLDGVLGVAPVVMNGVPAVNYKNRSSSSVMLIATTDQYLTTSGITLSAGRFMTKAEAEGNRDVCVIGADIAEKLFIRESPIGKRLFAAGEALEVIGVIERRGTVLGQFNLDSQVIIPIRKMFTSFRWNPSCVIDVKVGDPARLDTVREELRGLLRKIRRVPPGQPDDFAINQQEELLNRFRKVSGVIATAGFFITGLSLFVGGIGIMNIMFVSVVERTAEIGLRKALGARRRTILLQFLIEAASVALIGGFIALVVARGLVEVGKQFLSTLALSPGVVLLALGVALATGIVSGFLPAWRAARMTPVEALRND
jgi:putative ABC transport system permease protein